MLRTERTGQARDGSRCGLDMPRQLVQETVDLLGRAGAAGEEGGACLL